jgi:nicotinate-nucleotide adenylyltransferase
MGKIAIFGGTYDPIHIGHIRGLIEAQEIMDFEKVYVVPTGIPPHKQKEQHTDPLDRLEMVRLAVGGFDFVEISTFEIEQREISYTINTIDHFGKAHGYESLTLLIGSDSLLEINTWYRYEEILDRSDFAILPRPGFRDTEDSEKIEKTLSPVKIADFKKNYPYSGCDCIITDRKRKVIILNVNRLNVSSTEIRDKVKNGRSIKFLVTEPVEKYIIEKKLYRRCAK